MFLFTDTYIIACWALSASLPSTAIMIPLMCLTAAAATDQDGSRSNPITLWMTVTWNLFHWILKEKTCIFTISCFYLKSENALEAIQSPLRRSWKKNINNTKADFKVSQFWNSMQLILYSRYSAAVGLVCAILPSFICRTLVCLSHMSIIRFNVYLMFLEFQKRKCRWTMYCC